MPSTPDVKNELVRVVSQQVGERMSELATVLRLAGGLHTISGRIALEAAADDLVSSATTQHRKNST